MQLYLSRIAFGLIVGGLVVLGIVFSFVDFTVIEFDLDAQQEPVADYLRSQVEFKDVLARRLLGDDEAEIKFTLYTDFACEACGKFYQDVWSDLRLGTLKEDDIQFEFKFYPVLTVHPESLLAAQASLCAAEQGDFFGYHNLLFEKQDEWRGNVALEDYLISAAVSNRYNEDRFRQCIRSGKYEEFVKLELADAVDQGISGAPTMIITRGKDKEVVEGGLSLSLYEQAVRKLRGEDEAVSAESS